MHPVPALQRLFPVTLLHDDLSHHRHCCSQIFQEERHPSAMGIGSSKEGFSVFGSLNCCVSPVGRRLLRTWFLRPIIDLKVWQHANAIRKLLYTCINAPQAVQLRATSKQRQECVPAECTSGH
jgi:MutS domain III